jgi:glucokinase
MRAYSKDSPVHLAVDRCKLLGLSGLFTASDMRYEVA